MASNSETGHAKNIANLLSLNNSVTGIGALYLPSADRLKLPALTAMHTACAAAHSAVEPLRVIYNRDASERQDYYAPLRGGLVTQLLAIFNGTEALPNVKKTAKTAADKLRGSTKKTTPPPPGPDEAPEDVKHSTSQRSFVMQADNFEDLIAILAAEPTYDPAENELKIATLQARLTQMKALNNTVDLAYKALREARITRNRALYGKNGLVDTALDVKEYIKGAFTTKSPHYKGVSGLQFKRLAEDPDA
ncbi:MAG: hypothetical protein GC192_19685 [Bacteroidetes bacterium]|nr:hypothetical protein [Bacteroidota bacterium]